MQSSPDSCHFLCHITNIIPQHTILKHHQHRMTKQLQIRQHVLPTVTTKSAWVKTVAHVNTSQYQTVAWY